MEPEDPFFFFPDFPILSSILHPNPPPIPIPTPTSLDPIPLPPPSPLPLPLLTQATNNSYPMLQISNHPGFAYTLDLANSASSSSVSSNFMVPETQPGWWEAADQGIYIAPNLPIQEQFHPNYYYTPPFYNNISSTPNYLGQSSFVSQDPINPETVTAIAPQNTSASSLHALYNINKNNSSHHIMFDYSFPPYTIPTLPTHHHHDFLVTIPSSSSSSSSSSSFRHPPPAPFPPPPPPPPPPPQPEPVLDRNDRVGRGAVRRRQRTRVEVEVEEGEEITCVRGQWSPQEDSILTRLVGDGRKKKWSVIARRMKGRSSKQCRERWYNHLCPFIKKGAWSETEDMLLIMAHQQLGNKWAKISRRIPGRPENSVKNHWNATKRRRSKKLPIYMVNNMRTDVSDGSMLRAYIKSLTPKTTKAPPSPPPPPQDEPAPAANNHNNGALNDDDIDLMDWVAELLAGDEPVNAGYFDF